MTQWVTFGKEQTYSYNMHCEKEAYNVYETKALGSKLFTRGDEKSFNGYEDYCKSYEKNRKQLSYYMIVV